MKEVGVDRTNRAILAQLARDARLPWQQLGKRVHLTGQAVSARVQQMLDAGTIRRFTVVRGDLRRHFITVFMDSTRFDVFEAFLREHPDVESASKVAGEGCYHVTLACADDVALDAFTQALLQHGRYKVATELRRVKD